MQVAANLKAKNEIGAVLEHSLKANDFSKSRKKGLFLCHAGKLYKAADKNADKAANKTKGGDSHLAEGSRLTAEDSRLTEGSRLTETSRSTIESGVLSQVSASVL